MQKVSQREILISIQFSSFASCFVGLTAETKHFKLPHDKIQDANQSWEKTVTEVRQAEKKTKLSS